MTESTQMSDSLDETRQCRKKGLVCRLMHDRGCAWSPLVRKSVSEAYLLTQFDDDRVGGAVSCASHDLVNFALSGKKQENNPVS